MTYKSFADIKFNEADKITDVIGVGVPKFRLEQYRELSKFFKNNNVNIAISLRNAVCSEIDKLQDFHDKSLEDNPYMGDMTTTSI